MLVRHQGRREWGMWRVEELDVGLCKINFSDPQI